MNAIDTARALFVSLIALAWGAIDQIVFEWNNSTADTQIRFAAIAVSVAALIMYWLFGGGIVHIFM